MRHLLLTLVNLAAAWTLCAGEIYVSPAGDDRADGTPQRPLQSLHQALRQAREWRRTGDPRTAGGIRIILDGGTYPMSEPLFVRPEESGTADSPTVICPAEGADVLLSGGVEIGGWRQEGALWVADAPAVQGRPMIFRQMWSGDRRCLRAQQQAEGRMERMTDFDAVRRTITVPASAVEGLEGDSQLEMIVHQRWAIAILRVKEIRRCGEQAEVTFLEPESTLEFTHPWPQPVIGGERGNSSFVLANARRFVDTPGEWWQDYATGRIYYMPRPDERIEGFTLTAPLTERLVTVAGTAARPVEHLTFENIRFGYTAWNRPTTKGHVTLQGGFPLTDAYKLQREGLPWNAALENQAWTLRPDAAVSVSDARHITFSGCTFAHMGATGLDFASNVRHSAVCGSTFDDIGGTAIMVGSFAEGSHEAHIPFLLTADEGIFCEHIAVSGNTVRNATVEDWGAVGIGAGYVRDTEISGNEVAHVNYSGICVGWGWTAHENGMRNNRICGNYVHDFARQLYDAGGIYTLSNQPGSVISDNVIEDLGRAPYATNDRGFYIYLDEATDGYTIRDNHCPEERFGTNKPGPSVHWLRNGAAAKPRNRFLHKD